MTSEPILNLLASSCDGATDKQVENYVSIIILLSQS